MPAQGSGTAPGLSVEPVVEVSMALCAVVLAGDCQAAAECQAHLWVCGPQGHWQGPDPHSSCSGGSNSQDPRHKSINQVIGVVRSGWKETGLPLERADGRRVCSRQRPGPRPHRPKRVGHLPVPGQSFPGWDRGQEPKESMRGQLVMSEGGIMRAEVGEN